jgi:hypothetical protein
MAENPVSGITRLPVASVATFGIPPKDRVRYALALAPIFPARFKGGWNLLTRVTIPAVATVPVGREASGAPDPNGRTTGFGDLGLEVLGAKQIRGKKKQFYDVGLGPFVGAPSAASRSGRVCQRGMPRPDRCDRGVRGGVRRDLGHPPQAAGRSTDGGRGVSPALRLSRGERNDPFQSIAQRTTRAISSPVGLHPPRMPLILTKRNGTAKGPRKRFNEVFGLGIWIPPMGHSIVSVTGAAALPA